MRPDKVIHKEVFEAGEKLELLVPAGSRIVHIDEQYEDEICVWIEKPIAYERRVIIKIFVFATGQTIDDTHLRCEYFKSVVMRSMLVWHFYIGVDRIAVDN